MERIGQPDRADEYDQMSFDDYAEGRKLAEAVSDALEILRDRALAPSIFPTGRASRLQLSRSFSVLLIGIISPLEHCLWPPSTANNDVEGYSPRPEGTGGYERVYHPRS